MREIRIFELEHGEPAETWRLAQALQLHVSEGELWLTIGGDAHDYWLRAGESMTLAAGARVWLSAGGDGARFVLALGGASARASAEFHRQTVGFAGWIVQALPRLRQRAAWNARAVGRTAS